MDKISKIKAARDVLDLFDPAFADMSDKEQAEAIARFIVESDAVAMTLPAAALARLRGEWLQ